ncbi:NAD(P)H-dependent flavin oxidoreductase [Acinetobacter sp. MB5]|uniref:NAD(P)H-dependent flavin oxidoreductase n=1 Tax=Acinetobacter sp. MB5 TaxID=2069438 RepID=UPI000DD0BEAF|nr:nitronate monooxygenase [Acinetobacter sp. MB5]
MSILSQLNLEYPIFLAPMAGISTPKLAAEVSNAGGLGSLGLGASDLESCRKQILETQALTDRPFQVNFFCHRSEMVDVEISQQWIEYLQPHFEQFDQLAPESLKCIYPSFLDSDDYLNLVLELRPAAVSFHFGIPHHHQIQALKKAGIITMVTATNLSEAQAIEQAGIDIVIAQGIEAGGHRGIFNSDSDAAITTADLVQLLREYCSLPIVAAGGIMNGQQAEQMQNLGASAVQLGTAFIQCSSSNANTMYREALFDEPVTQISAAISGRPARGIFNDWHKKIDGIHRPEIPAYPYTYDIAKKLNALAAKHDHHGYAAFWAGSNVGQIRQLEAHELIKTLVKEMRA